MDGKHILIKPPARSDSYYFSYKHRFSVVLLAIIVDAITSLYIIIDIGCNGWTSHSDVFQKS